MTSILAFPIMLLDRLIQTQMDAFIEHIKYRCMPNDFSIHASVLDLLNGAVHCRLALLLHWVSIVHVIHNTVL